MAAVVPGPIFARSASPFGGPPSPKRHGSTFQFHKRRDDSVDCTARGSCQQRIGAGCASSIAVCAPVLSNRGLARLGQRGCSSLFRCVLWAPRCLSAIEVEVTEALPGSHTPLDAHLWVCAGTHPSAATGPGISWTPHSAPPHHLNTYSGQLQLPPRLQHHLQQQPQVSGMAHTEIADGSRHFAAGDTCVTWCVLRHFIPCVVFIGLAPAAHSFSGKQPSAAGALEWWSTIRSAPQAGPVSCPSFRCWI